MTAALLRGWWLVAVVTALGLLGSVLALTVTPRTYEATATLQVPSASTLSSSVRADDLAYTDRLVNTYKHIAELRDVRAEVARRAGVAGTADLSVTIEPNTELLHVTARAGRGIDAAREANAAAAVLIERVGAEARGLAGKTPSAIASELAGVRRELARLQEQLAAATDTAERAELEQEITLREFDYQALSSQAAQMSAARDTRDRRLLLVERADVPSAPASPHKAPILGLGLVLGLAAGAALVLVLERRSPRLATLDEIEEAAGSSVLGTVPRARRGQPVGIFNGGSFEQEAFGALRARLLAEREEWPHSLLVTSAEEQAGKSVIAANLAVALARARHRVVLVDLDMRRPQLHRLLGIENGDGASDILRGTDLAMEALHTTLHATDEPRLDLITSGSPVPNPAELLASRRFGQMLHVLELRYEFVVIDAPALGPVSDAANVASQVDQVLLVVARTPVEDRHLRQVIHQLDAIGAQSVGVVVNRWPHVPRSAYLGVAS